MNKEDLNKIKIILQEELMPIRTDLTEIKQNQSQLSKDITVSLGQYHDKLEKYVDNRTY